MGIGEYLAFVGEQGAPAVAGYPGCGLPTRLFELCKLTCGSQNAMGPGVGVWV
jgi:hypothetical protein